MYFCYGGITDQFIFRTILVLIEVICKVSRASQQNLHPWKWYLLPFNEDFSFFFPILCFEWAQKWSEAHILEIKSALQWKINVSKIYWSVKMLWHRPTIILGYPGAVSRVERKGRTKVFKYGRKSPWVPTLTGPFPKIQADAGSWLGTKNALYYCAQSANTSPEFFSWVRTRRLLSLSRLVWL